MQTIQNQTTIRRVQEGSAASQVSDQQLEQAISVSMVGDLNDQLAGISETMRQQLADKQIIRQDLSNLQSFNSRCIAKTSQGEEAITVTDKEYSELVKKQPGFQFERIPDGSGYYLKKDSLKNVIDGAQEKLASLNSNTEMTMLQIQSLVDQRKNALTMLSNLISARNETMMGIIRNLKN